METNPVLEAIRRRRTIREFSSKKIPEQLLYELLDAANTAPSGFNLQPWHFIIVRDQDLKEILKHVALGQKQVVHAPCVVVFAADPDAWKTQYDKVLAQSVEHGALARDQALFNRKMVNRLFSTDPCGLFGLLKRVIIPFQRLRKPVPNVVTSFAEAKSYVQTQTAFAAATFLIAASGAGLGACPMEGFDEERLKKLLAVPTRMTIPLIIALGYPLEGEEIKPQLRLPLREKLSVDLFPNKLSRAVKPPAAAG
ncbi:MAG TPA: nitroreductase family protein [Oligoflexia bacterium]|nr:nitroreductase family protein [Oligoflexia bacterium]